MSPLRRAIRAFPALLRVGMAEMVAYRAEVIIWILTATLPLIMLAVWDRVADGGPVSGFGRADFARYFVAVLVVRQFTSTWIVWELNQSIRTGSLSAALLRPVHPLLLPAAESLATIPIRTAVLLPMILLLWLWRPDMGVGVDLAHAPLLAASILLAWALHFTVQAAFGCLAFWLDQSLGVYNVWFGLWALLSGYLVPVDLMPEGVRQVVQWLPFRALLGVPVEIGAGLLRGTEALAAVVAQVAWLAAAVWIASGVWRRGLARYGAFGA